MNEEPWPPEKATTYIREIAKDRQFSLLKKIHATDRMAERGVIMSDILFVLKNGFVFEDAACATQNGYYKYAIECKTPNSESRTIRLIVIPEMTHCRIKLLTVMWSDEKSTCAGTITEEEK